MSSRTRRANSDTSFSCSARRRSISEPNAATDADPAPSIHAISASSNRPASRLFWICDSNSSAASTCFPASCRILRSPNSFRNFSSASFAATEETSFRSFSTLRAAAAAPASRLLWAATLASSLACCSIAIKAGDWRESAESPCRYCSAPCASFFSKKARASDSIRAKAFERSA